MPSPATFPPAPAMAPPSPLRRGPKRALLIGIPALLLLGLVGARLVAVRQKAAEQKAQSAGRKGGAPAVEVAAAGPRTIQASLEVIGDAESPNVARLAPKTTGPIIGIEVREGDEVRAGQVVFRIDPREAEGEVSAARATVAEAQARLAQAEATTSATLVGIEGTVVGGEAGVSRAQAELSQAQRNQAALIAASRASVADLNARISGANADVRSAEANVTAAEANLNNARIRYDRTAELQKGGYIAAQDVDDAKAQVRVQEGALGVAKAAVASRKQAAAGLAAQRRAAEAQVGVVRRQSDAAIATAKAGVRSARAALGTAAANRAQGAAYRENLSALRAGVEAARSLLDQAAARRADTALRSPIDGTVTARSADLGSLASPGTPVVTVQSLKPLFIEAAIPPDAGGAIQVGAKVGLAFDALPGRTIEGQIAGINRAADLQNRRYSVRVVIPNEDEAVRPGMFARLTLVTRTTEAAVAVPLTAVQGSPSDDGQVARTSNREAARAFVLVVGADGKAERRAVTLGERDGRYVQVRSGLRLGERVVTLSYNAVKDGTKVTVGPPESTVAGEGAIKSGGGRDGGRNGGKARS